MSNFDSVALLKHDTATHLDRLDHLLDILEQSEPPAQKIAKTFQLITTTLKGQALLHWQLTGHAKQQYLQIPLKNAGTVKDDRFIALSNAEITLNPQRIDLHISSAERVEPAQLFSADACAQLKAAHIAALHLKVIKVSGQATHVFALGINGKDQNWNSENDTFFSAATRIIVNHCNLAEKASDHQELKETERYRNFFSHSSDSIYYINCGKPVPKNMPIDQQVDQYYKHAFIEDANHTMAKSYGYDNPEAFIGIKVYDIHKGENFAENAASLEALVNNNYRIANIETTEVDQTGKQHYYLNHAFGVLEKDCLIGIWGTQQDITAQKNAEKALLESEALQKAVLNTLPDLKFRMNIDGTILDYYPSTVPSEKPLLPPEEFLGKKVEDVVPTYISRGIMANIRRAIQTREITSFEYALSRKGKLKYYELRTSAIDNQEVIATIRNVTEMKNAKQILQEKVRELDNKNRQLQEYIDSNMQLENFAYIASHDLREPVRTMRTFAQLLEKRYIDTLDEVGVTYLNFIIDAAKDMNNLINDLLSFSRVNNAEYERDDINIPALIKEVTGGLTDIIYEKRAVVKLGNLPEHICGHPTLLRQLFQNLIVNAIKYSKQDTPPVIVIAAMETDAYYQFSIQDNGIGINSDFFDKIFLIFKKLHSRKDYHGTGIGLAICKKIVAHHKGRIWVESQPGEGTTFYFTIQK